ncbi:hypothetical protein [Acuticoccus mangrovi]|uniref:Uncharacterized protein n=1 Tax=Acuticoccus mangrovi TaxID=2796142 RepID=A0A934IL22_9HYPH|nr:hypothetical protein [Acuticoccus mangrovi]MBJ3774278.1 hypothetical protein [Acuticoccus mangrovi]
MQLVLLLLAALWQGPTGIADPGVAAARARFAAPIATAAEHCRRDGEAPRGTGGFAFGRADHQIAAYPATRWLACLAAVEVPQARPAAVRIAAIATNRPRTVAALAEAAGWCDGEACGVLRCGAIEHDGVRLACLRRLPGPASPERRDLIAAARVKRAADDYATLVAARATFADLVAGGYYPALANLALVEYRLTNLDEAYRFAEEGASYGLPTAKALAAYLKIEGFGGAWDLPGAARLAASALAAGSRDGSAVLALDVSYLFSPQHWRMVQEALVASRIHPGPVDGHFRESWRDALAVFAAGRGLPQGITLATLDALGLLEEVNSTMRQQRVIRRY